MAIEANTLLHTTCNTATSSSASWCNQLYHGDCFEILKTVPDNTVDIVITDPPYFLHSLDNDWDVGKIKKQFKQAITIKNLPAGMRFHRKQADKLRTFYTRISEEILRIVKPGAFFLSFSQPRLSFAMAQAVHDAGFEVRDTYTWYYNNKAQAKAFSQNHFIDRMNITESEKTDLKLNLNDRKTPQLRPQTELIIMAQKPREGTFVENWKKYRTGLINVQARLNGNSPSTLMHAEKPVREPYNTHLTVKPITLIKHLLEVFSSPRQLVLDPFLGSGTTVIAALQTNRHYLGIEINQEYINIAQQRIRSCI